MIFPRKVVTFAFVLALASVVLVAWAAPVMARDIPTYAFLSVVPNPVGVNQQVWVTMWLSEPPPTAFGPGGDRWGGFMVTIEKPDGTSEKKGPYSSDAVGAAYFIYVPDQVGTYYFQFSFPGQTIAGNYYMPSTSPKVSLTVQAEPIPSWPEAELPKSYWQRPIYAENREWCSISGNWLMPWYNGTFMFGGFNPYTTAPNTAHIVWKKPIMFGGLVGGEFGWETYYTGLSYEWRFQPIILQGRLYFNMPVSSSFSKGVVCLDLRTGEEIWYRTDMSSISLAQVYVYHSPNQHGAIPYLWSISGTTWKMYDAFTGEWICDITGAPQAGFFATTTSKTVYGGNGELIVYMLDGVKNWLLRWNSSKCIMSAVPAFGPMAWMWRPPLGGTIQWKNGIEWNVTFQGVPGQRLSLNKVGSGVLLATTGSFSAADNVTYVAFDMKTGRELWRRTYPITPGSNEAYFGSSNTPLLYGVFERFKKSTMQFIGIDAFTGEEIWVTEPFTNAWGMYDETGAAAYGIFYTMAYDGMIHAYDIKTGKHLWDYYTGSSGYETPYGQWPFYVINGWAIADGKVFACTGEHSPDSPPFRGFRLHVVDAFNGRPVWNISGYWMFPAIADGYLVVFNGYDMQIYCFGKGKTSITLEAPLTAVPKGSSIIIRGKVLDESPSQKGTPAVADEDMTQWMEYLNMQKPMPQKVRGVTVELYAVAEDGSIISIGRATTDPLNGGIFSMVWTPPKEGKYAITAVFPGSESYWDSYASTAIAVTAAPPEAPASATPEQVSTVQATVEALQPLITALTIIVIICLILVTYDIYINRKTLKQTTK